MSFIATCPSIVKNRRFATYSFIENIDKYLQISRRNVKETVVYVCCLIPGQQCKNYYRYLGCILPHQSTRRAERAVWLISCACGSSA